MMIINLVESAKDTSPKEIHPSSNEKIQRRIDSYRAFLAGLRKEWNGETVNVWQEHLLRLLKELGYEKDEIKEAVLTVFPENDTNVSPDVRLVFNRAAMYLWGPQTRKIYSDA